MKSLAAALFFLSFALAPVAASTGAPDTLTASGQEGLAAARRAEILLRQKKPAEALALVDSLEVSGPALANEELSLQIVILRAAALLDMGQVAPAETLLVQAIERLEQRGRSQSNQKSRAGVQEKTGELYAALARSHLLAGRAADAWAAVERGRLPDFLSRLRAGGSGHQAAGSASPEPAPRVSLSAVQEALRRVDGVLIEFNDPRLSPLAAFVITPDSLHVVSLGENEAKIRSDALTAADFLAEGELAGRDLPLLDRLSQNLVGPILAKIPADNRRLFWILPSSLAAFPVEAVPLGPGDRETVGERYAVSFLPAASILNVPDRSPAPRGMMVFADPVVRPEVLEAGIGALARDRPDAWPLPYAREEARTVAVQHALILSGRRADMAHAISGAAQKAAVLHFATLAVLRPSRPEESAIVLAGDDGLLTAARVESLDLSADLVTLSGCRIGRGPAMLEEGILGLPRSFLRAGARSVVTARWDVDDRAASRFMGAFYEALRTGMPRDEALQAARSRLKREGYPPRDWAAFLLTGDGSQPVPALAGVAPLSRSPLALIVALATGLVGLYILFTGRIKKTGRKAETASPRVH